MLTKKRNFVNRACHSSLPKLTAVQKANEQSLRASTDPDGRAEVRHLLWWADLKLCLLGTCSHSQVTLAASPASSCPNLRLQTPAEPRC